MWPRMHFQGLYVFWTATDVSVIQNREVSAILGVILTHAVEPHLMDTSQQQTLAYYNGRKFS